MPMGGHGTVRCAANSCRQIKPLVGSKKASWATMRKRERWLFLKPGGGRGVLPLPFSKTFHLPLQNFNTVVKCRGRTRPTSDSDSGPMGGVTATDRQRTESQSLPPHAMKDQTDLRKNPRLKRPSRQLGRPPPASLTRARPLEPST